MPPITFVLYGRPNCHLCDRLQELIKPHLDTLALSTPIKFFKCNVDNDPEWVERYGDRIPVLTRNGQEILQLRPTADQIAHALGHKEQPTTRRSRSGSGRS